MTRRLLATAIGAVMVVVIGISATRTESETRPVHEQTKQTRVVVDPSGMSLTGAGVRVAYAQAQEQQQLAEYLAAVKQAEDQQALAAYVATLPRIQVDTGHWLRINQCEEGGTWINDGWTSDGHFQGGLGMSVEAWNEVVAEGPAYNVYLPPSSNMATPEQQMQGAQILYNRVGPGGWACK